MSDTHQLVEEANELCRRLVGTLADRRIVQRADDRFYRRLRECRCGHCEDRRAMEMALDKSDRAYDEERGK